MGDVNIVIDGHEIKGLDGMTILEAAEQNGIEIPTLCHSPQLTPAGVCRVCVVEVEGAKTLVGSCHTPITEGMVIRTRSHKVLAARKAILELLLTAHTGDCVTDMDAKDCELHRIASLLEVGPPRFRVRRQRSYPAEENNPHVRRNLSKCILCRRCIKACSEIAKQDVFSVGYRGFQSKIVVDFDDALLNEVCRDCDICIDLCPTGALSKPLSEEETGVG
jgi:NADH dehydrogenase/NADH:ubiquinone oxidoreductase subunit G